MDEAVSSITLEVNNKKITNFKSVTEKGVSYRKPVNLMKKTLIKKVTPRYSLQVEYCETEDEPEVDWKNLQNGSLTIIYDSGRRKTYPEVSCTDVGELKHDEEGDPIIPIELVAGEPFNK